MSTWSTPSKTDLLNRLAAVRSELRRVEEDLFRLRGSQGETVPVVAFAKAIYAARRLRHDFFPRAMFADPAWDLLLDLYVARAEGRSVSTSSACLGARVPQTTGLRWLDKLEQAGAIVRRAASDDLRMINVELSPQTYEVMTKLLTRMSDEAPVAP